MESAADHLKADTLVKIPLQRKSQTLLALADLIEGFKRWPVWFLLACQDIKLRYRRSVLGPFWITISMAITVYTMGFLYGHLFRSELQTYYPFLVSGMLAWAVISSMVLELTEGFILSETLMKQIKLPHSLYVHRIIARNIIIFFHNLLVMIPVVIIFHQTAKINFYTLMLIPGLAIIYINALFYGILISMVGARFRDVAQIIRSLIQVTFFITPIMWNPAILPPQKRYLAELNPFYSFVELIRAPLLGHSPTWGNWIMVTFITAVGVVLSFSIFKKYRARIVYWV